MSNDFQHSYGPWAIVTGASSGIGEAFVHALAARGISSVLVSRREDELHRVINDVHQRHGINCLAVLLDLADSQFIDTLTQATEGLDIGLVVGNAAFNPVGAFSDLSSNDLMRIIDVNDRANLLLASKYLPKLKARGRGGFLLVASSEAFFGAPYSACYSASKAFVLSLGEALWGEMKGTGVDVLVLAPSATDTPLLASRDLGDMKIRVMSAMEVANIGLDNLPDGPYIIPGARNRIFFGLMRHLPRGFAIRLMAPVTKKVVRRSQRSN